MNENNGYDYNNQQNSYSQPTYNQPTYNQPTYNQPTYNQPAYNQPAYGQPAYGQPSAPTVNPNGPTPSSVLTWGILGLAFCGSGILGLIFSIIGKNKARDFLSWNGSLFAQAKVGSILAKVGFIISIVMTVIWVIYIIVFALAIANGGF